MGKDLHENERNPMNIVYKLAYGTGVVVAWFKWQISWIKIKLTS